MQSEFFSKEELRVSGTINSAFLFNRTLFMCLPYLKQLQSYTPACSFIWTVVNASARVQFLNVVLFLYARNYLTRMYFNNREDILIKWYLA